MMLNCSNCGAPLKSDICEYCGTYYPDKVSLSKSAVNDLISRKALLGIVEEIECKISDEKAVFSALGLNKAIVSIDRYTG